MPQEAIGWLATVAFTASYFFREKRQLLLVQVVAALLWLAYGVVIHSRPVIVANILVASAAGVGFLRALRDPRTPPPAA
ncbi:MAG: hypothetical protein RL653_1942 [Pseudomonadota bacterium]|jgi:hypothetical protein